MNAAKIKKKQIASKFVSHGLSLRPDALKLILQHLTKFSKQEAVETLKLLLDAVATVMRSQEDSTNDLFVEKSTIEHAFNLITKTTNRTLTNIENTPPYTQDSKKGVQKGQEYSGSQNIPKSIQADSRNQQLSQLAQKSQLETKLSNSIIFLSNFGEIPKISFNNAKRNLMVFNQKPESNGIALEAGDEFLTKENVELYHRMRFLIVKSERYIFEHSAHSKHGKVVLSEIGSLTGRKGEFRIFGLLYKVAHK